MLNFEHSKVIEHCLFFQKTRELFLENFILKSSGKRYVHLQVGIGVLGNSELKKLA
jgi:hypothetical protein